MNVLLAVALAGLVPAGGAAARDEAKAKKDAEALLRRGATKLQNREYAPALEDFKAACAIFNSPKIQFDIALAHAQLGNHADAMRAVQSFIGSGVADEASLAEAQHLAASLATKVAVVHVTGVAPGTELLIDDEVVGTAPASSLYVMPGRHTVAGRRSGESLVAKTIDAVAGKAETVDLGASRTAPPAPVVESKPATRDEDTRVPPRAGLSPNPPLPPAPSLALRAPAPATNETGATTVVAKPHEGQTERSRAPYYIGGGVVLAAAAVGLTLLLTASDRAPESTLGHVPAP